MSPSNASTTCRLRSNSKAELAQQASAAEGTVKDKSTKRSKSSCSKSSGKKRKHQDHQEKLIYLFKAILTIYTIPWIYMAAYAVSG